MLNCEHTGINSLQVTRSKITQRGITFLALFLKRLHMPMFSLLTILITHSIRTPSTEVIDRMYQLVSLGKLLKVKFRPCRMKPFQSKARVFEKEIIMPSIQAKGLELLL